MAKSKKQEGEQVQEGFVRLFHTGPTGGYTDFEKNHAKRLLSLEKSIGAQNYIEQTDGAGPDQDNAAMGEAEESDRD